MSASLKMSIRFTLPSDLTGRLFSSIAVSHALISIISIQSSKYEHYHIQVTSQV
jgi:hypothetical protein